MTASGSSTALTPGHRIPNFALPIADGRTLIFYEFAVGEPLLLGVCATEWEAATCGRFAELVHELAKKHSLQSVVIVGDANNLGPPEPTAVTVVDAERTQRSRLFGDVVDGVEGALLVTDPNLRVLHGAVVEEAGIETGAAMTGVEALIDRSLRTLELERTRVPAIAPVLVVPRVLSPELCRSLVEGFEGWSPKPSPMPASDGHGRAVDDRRKSRLDVMIDDARLERDLMQQVAARVQPDLYKAFAYRATRFERIKLVCYRADASGHFGTHRDNTAPATAHRRFAITINLNSGDYEGGQLEFPEYGPGCVVEVPTGAAILFSGTHAHRVRPVTRGERFALITFAFGDESVTTPNSRPDARLADPKATPI